MPNGANYTNTPCDVGTVQVRDCEFRDDLLTLGGADVIAAGTILARSSASLKLVIFVKGGVSNGNGIPKCVLAHEVTALGAGDEPVRVIQSGVLNKSKLIIDADGDDTNVDAAVLDQLRDYKIEAVSVAQLGRLDNPQPEPDES